METFTIGNILQQRLELPKKKIEWEFQAVCLECEEYFGKNPIIWLQPFRKGVTENIIRYALKECKTRNKKFVGYFVKIISNKIKKSSPSASFIN